MVTWLLFDSCATRAISGMWRQCWFPTAVLFRGKWLVSDSDLCLCNHTANVHRESMKSSRLEQEKLLALTLQQTQGLWGNEWKPTEYFGVVTSEATETRPRMFACTQCDYQGHRMYHTRMHHERIHVAKGRAVPGKWKVQTPAKKTEKEERMRIRARRGPRLPAAGHLDKNEQIVAAAPTENRRSLLLSLLTSGTTPSKKEDTHKGPPPPGTRRGCGARAKLACQPIFREELSLPPQSMHVVRMALDNPPSTTATMASASRVLAETSLFHGADTIKKQTLLTFGKVDIHWNGTAGSAH